MPSRCICFPIDILFRWQTFAYSSTHARLITLLHSLRLKLDSTERRYGLCSKSLLLILTHAGFCYVGAYLPSQCSSVVFMAELCEDGIRRRLPTLTRRDRERVRLVADGVNDSGQHMDLCRAQKPAVVERAPAKVRLLPHYTNS